MRKAKFTCPRRRESSIHVGENLDSYEKGHGVIGQKRGCTYCGSMHPDDFMDAVREGKEIGPTDKSYKFYVDDHAGKFYTSHLSPEQGHEFWQLHKEGKVNWGYPGHPYVPLYLPGPSDVLRKGPE